MFVARKLSRTFSRFKKRKESSEQADPVSAVFTNQSLVEKILELATNDIRDDMNFRLVNKTFRNSCHAILRKNHRSVKIEHISADFDDEVEEFHKDHVYINYHLIKISNVDNYFHFLKNTASVKVDSISVKNLFMLTKEKQKILHDSIIKTLIGNDHKTIKTLIGMDEICYIGCEDCDQIPRKCLEYGPISIKNLRESFTEPCFFKKLFITDYILDNVANTCVKSSTTKEECLNAVENLVNSNITSETLVLMISESRKRWIGQQNEIPRTLFNKLIERLDERLQPMPREVLEIILKKWKIQRVILKIVQDTHRKMHSGEWISKNWFSNLCLNDDYPNVKISSPELKVGDVCLDLKDSFTCACSLQAQEPFRNIPTRPLMHQQGLNVISNVRRVFLCDKISIECSHWKQRLCLPIEEAVKRRSLRQDIVTKEAQENLEVNIRMFATHRNSAEVFKDLIEKTELNPDFYEGFSIHSIPSPPPICHRIIQAKNYPRFILVEKEWIGDAIRMVNRRQNLAINWEFFIEKEEPGRLLNNL